MARIFIKRLTKKYGKTNLTGKKYQALISEILAHNNEKVGNAVSRLSKDNYEDQLKRLKKNRAATVKLPDISEVLPKRSVFLVKAAQSGQAISDTLRASLESNLRNVLKEHTGAGKPKMEIQRGKTTGKMNTELIDKFQKSMIKTYESRTRKDPSLGVPGNVKQIAITEVRSVVSSIKRNYNENLLKSNPNLEMTKTWLQNRKLAMKPRRSHREQNGKTILMNEFFQVEREQAGGYDYMHGPYDPTAAAENTIGCNCDIIYKVRFVS